MTDGDKTSTAEKRFSGEALVAISTAAAALVTTVGALATTGALQEMQRDHGILVIFAFAFVLIGASIWAVLAVTKPKATESSREAVAASAEMLGWLERLRDAKGASRFSAEERLSEVVNSLPVTGAQRLFSEHELDLRKSLGEAKGDDDKTLSVAKKMQAAPTPSAAAIPATAVPYIEAIRQAHDSAKLPYAEKLLDVIAPSKGAGSGSGSPVVSQANNYSRPWLCRRLRLVSALGSGRWSRLSERRIAPQWLPRSTRRNSSWRVPPRHTTWAWMGGC